MSSPAHIPQEYQLRTRIQVPVLSHKLDFSIHYTIWGELLQADTLVSQLPLSAQKMMYGKDFAVVSSHIEQLPQLLRYQLPLALVQNARLPYLQPAVVSARQAQQAQATSLRQIMRQYCRDRWLLFLYNVERSSSERKLLDITNQLIILVQGNDKKIFRCVRQLQQLAPPLIYIPVLHSILPFQKAELRRYLYQQLGQIRLLQNRDFLLQQLPIESATHLRTKIINGLQHYPNKVVYQQFITHYYQTDWTRDKYKELAALLERLSYYAHDDIIPIAKAELLTPNSAISEWSRKILRKRGLTEAALAELLPDIFDEELLEVTVNTALEHYVTLRNKRLLPDPHRLLDLIVLYGQRYPSAGSPMRVFHKLAILFRKNFRPEHYRDILQLLRYHDDRLQRAGLHLLHSLEDGLPLPEDPRYAQTREVGESIIRQLLLLITTAWTETRIETLHLLQKQYTHWATSDWLPVLRALAVHSNPLANWATVGLLC
ncbi:MAG: hypothetical protein AAGK47_05435, partial [Bacteroidota bacterium]